MNETYNTGIKGIVVGLTQSTAVIQDGTLVTSYGVKIGLVTLGTGISATKGTTTQTGGSKDTNEKKQ